MEVEQTAKDRKEALAARSRRHKRNTGGDIPLRFSACFCFDSTRNGRERLAFFQFPRSSDTRMREHRRA